MRAILLMLLLLAPLAAVGQMGPAADCGIPAAAEDGWEVADPVTAGFDQATLCRIGPRFSTWKEADIHSVLVARHGKLVYEHYFTNPDERRGIAVGEVAYDASMKHDLRSISKSVTALVLGIAIGKGWISGIDQPVLPLFPEYSDLRSAEKDKITLRHLLTMSKGLIWNEDLPYTDPGNSETKMNDAADPVRYAFAQPVLAEAGAVYNYSGGSATIISALLHKVTGERLDALAQRELFEPMGIADVEWQRFPSGEPRAASGLRMRPRDLLKIGQRVLDHGAWRGRQVVPADWVAAATSTQVNGPQIYFYGYQFWLGRSLVRGREVAWAAGVGLGGQRLFIMPSLDLVVLVHAGLYNRPAQWPYPLSVLNRHVLAALESEP